MSPPSAESAEEAAAPAVAPPTPCSASLAVATTAALRLSSGISLAERSCKPRKEVRESLRGGVAPYGMRVREEDARSRRAGKRVWGKGPMNGECGGQRCRGCHECRAEGGEGEREGLLWIRDWNNAASRVVRCAASLESRGQRRLDEGGGAGGGRGPGTDGRGADARACSPPGERIALDGPTLSGGLWRVAEGASSGCERERAQGRPKSGS